MRIPEVLFSPHQFFIVEHKRIAGALLQGNVTLQGSTTSWPQLLRLKKK